MNLLTVPSLTVVLDDAACETPSRITARVTALFGNSGGSAFKSIFVWPYNNVVALGNLCAHLRQTRYAGYRTKYLVLLDMRFTSDEDTTLRHLLKLLEDPLTAVVLYNVGSVSEKTHVPVEIMDSVRYVVREGARVSTDTAGIPVRYPAEKRARQKNVQTQLAADLALLGLDPADSTITIQLIRKQYKRAALESHPDKNEPAVAETCKERFREVHAAYKRVEVFFCLPKSSDGR